MLTTEQIKNQISNVLEKTDFKIGKRYQGKVRDNYFEEDKLVIVVTDRISCFDSVIGTIPFKGQALNQMAAFWFDRTKDIVQNHVKDIPDPNVMVVKKCEPIPIEVVVRGYMTGSLWRDYEKGGRDMYGFEFNERIMKNQLFETPMLTPTTKATEGHDLPISKEEIIKQGVVSKELWDEIENTALRLFERGTEVCRDQNLILVDTKYEFGLIDGKLVLMDEIHTPDSSRFWYQDTYNESFNKVEDPKQLDKEYIRQWLIKKRNYIGDGPIPKLSDEVIIEAARRYIEIYEQITGKDFEITDDPINKRVEDNLKKNGYI
ncbi:phosphoribosylaminoimidazolesuccinocarboxamide synthase [Candidatus Woesearchaeota archaeon]|nr:phosphoribosylaminoimidazolesuccinocarboxamide synthase [Candidatus Woesearchaeota archaeon]